jgi:hypothetical protein
MLIDLLEISVKDFKLGGIAKFDLLAQSKWNQPISGVYAHLIVNDQKGDKVADFKSASLDMAAFEKAHMFAYWDTEGINEGDYITKVAINYGDRVTEREVNTKVGLNSISTEIGGLSSGAITASGDLSSQYPIILLVAVLVAINFAWFLYFRKRKK